MAKECMTAILLDENALEDGTVMNEREFSDAAATAFLGKAHLSSKVSRANISLRRIRHGTTFLI